MKTKLTKYSAVLPWFVGFYDSILDSYIDREIEDEMNVYGESDRPKKTWEEVDAVANYSAARAAITKAWVEAFARETGLEMEYETLESPREYNFTTDRAYVLIPESTLEKLADALDSQEFKDVLKEWFTSRDGFMSFYSAYVEDEEWQKDIREWDHNQLSALIAAYVLHSGETQEHLLECIHDTSSVYEAAQEVWNVVPKEVSA